MKSFFLVLMLVSSSNILAVKAVPVEEQDDCLILFGIVDDDYRIFEKGYETCAWQACLQGFCELLEKLLTNHVEESEKTSDSYQKFRLLLNHIKTNAENPNCSDFVDHR